ncbi:MAG: hypothetical protein U0794_02660 [Isosphaeraceae bacterium]
MPAPLPDRVAVLSGTVGLGEHLEQAAAAALAVFLGGLARLGGARRMARSWLRRRSGNQGARP